ncbi:P27 family phage terminase small subunit [Bradyrhizobium barranii]|uniref:P27 family phage terminase small subunit n=1 Tax=Bradyrhizobium TaxID=374 RepID=UPI003F28827C
MGRHPDNPLDQAAKGYPGKRKTKTEKAILEAERLAGMLVAVRTQTPSENKPGYLQDLRLKGASVMWDDYAPRLDRLHLLSQLDLHLFAMFCIYAAEFVAANEEILTKGYSVMVKTISGDKMPRENPAVGRRDHAAKMTIDLSSKFGLSPQDRHRLLAAGAMHFDDDTLFGRAVQRPAAAPATPEDDASESAPAAEPIPAPVAEGSAIGSLSAFDSVPPGTKPN